MASAIPAGFRALPLPIAQLSLAAVLKCGQSFRWTALPLISTGLTTTGSSSPDATNLDVEYRLALKDRVVCLRQSSDMLFYRTVFPDAKSGSSKSALDRDAETLAWLRDYFQLDVDLIKLYDTWGKMDPVFGKLRSRFAGIRMLRQDPWENLVSFICSQNNHISRITGMVQSLCTHFSPALLSMPHPNTSSSLTPSETTALTYHAFPSPALLAAPGTSATLRTLGFGYRAEYLQRTAQMLVDAHGADGAEDFVSGLRKRSTDEAREELLQFIGVGRKVADCVLLMSLDKREVVPVDTHVHQIAMKHYGMRGSGSGIKAAMTPKLYSEVQTKLAGMWGEYAGWAHSVLFTADLKSFSTYGLPTPSPSPQKAIGKGKMKAVVMIPDPDASPVRATKRKRVVMKTGGEEILEDTLIFVQESEGGLVDRVKRRRRTVVQRYLETVSR